MSRFAWTLHNILGHPLSEMLHLFGLARASRWVHDVTMPRDIAPTVRAQR